jgi:hypothetical protein
MARLSTPSHPCEVKHVTATGAPNGTCRRDAYRKMPPGLPLAGQWVCKPCRTRITRRAAPPPSPFTVVGTWPGAR